MTFVENLSLLAERPLATAGRTLVVTVLSPRETVFNYLADIENLPRWAAGFCEHLSLHREGWSALTSCGELILSIEADGSAGTIDLHAGWTPDALSCLPLTIKRDPEGVTRIKFELASGATPEHIQLFLALEQEVRRLVTRFDAGMLGSAQ